ncbi:histidine kinase [Alteromonas sp. MMG017]|uniref:sensor histidine kinase n=1 Tax=Alteromonas sp. MMG017 TaxID=2822692 RepID=UPI001B3A5F09|nr:histidine kinase [Alteromonas sp. MMG017]MBQ4829130.1 histidine kinase [Alteromonas sp. MMG017]
MKARTNTLIYFLLFSAMAALVVAGTAMFQSNRANEVDENIIFSNTYYWSEDHQQDFRSRPSERTNWRSSTFRGIAHVDTPIWVQIDFTIDELSPNPMGVFVSVMGSFDAYWNGEYIGSNGKPALTKEEEVIGDIDKVLLINKDAVVIGQNTLSLYLSSHHHPSEVQYGGFFAFVSDYTTLIAMSIKRALPSLLMLSALGLLAVYCFMLFASAWREVQYLLFGLLCSATMLLIITESARGIIGYTYDWHLPRLELVLGLSCCLGILFVAFITCVVKLSSAWKLGWLSLVLGIQGYWLLTLSGYDDRSLLVFVSSVGICGLVCIQGLVQKRAHSGKLLCALLVFISPVLSNTYSYMDTFFFISFSVLNVFILYLTLNSIRTERQALLQSQLNASRMELELLKRNLQPHFIMNTLTAIEEWIEEDPKTAVNFIQALANEFRLLIKLSQQPLIALEHEIALCQSHLTIMGYRACVDFQLSQDIKNAQVLLPPGVLLTLLENAISHNRYREGAFEFQLTQRLNGNKQTLTLQIPLSPYQGSSGLQTGIGNKYIQSRFKESFNHDWAMQERRDSQAVTVALSFPMIEKGVTCNIG